MIIFLAEEKIMQETRKKKTVTNANYQKEHGKQKINTEDKGSNLSDQCS